MDVTRYWTTKRTRALTYPLKNIGSGILTYLQDGLNPTVHDLLILMIIISDNTATNIIMRRIGVKKIDDYMKELGVGDIHIAFDICGIFDDVYGDEEADPKAFIGDITKPRTAPPTSREGVACRGGAVNNAATRLDMTRRCTSSTAAS